MLSCLLSKNTISSSSFRCERGVRQSNDVSALTSSSSLNNKHLQEENKNRDKYSRHAVAKL